MNKITPLICILFLVGCVESYAPAVSHNVFDEYYDYNKLQSEFSSISNRFHEIELESDNIRRVTGAKEDFAGVAGTHEERIEKLENYTSRLLSLITDLQENVSELNSSVSLLKADLALCPCE
ncbi:MAG TPA: hypothetical protein ENH34_00480 [Phycisphaerales bacterium]|nr:hypothetical protein [Phycisphaerales bacterium]